jgi:hypothetical protein
MTVLNRNLRVNVRHCVAGKGLTFQQLRQVLTVCLKHQSHLRTTAYPLIGINYIVKGVLTA